MAPSAPSGQSRHATLILIVGIILFAASGLGLLLTGNSDIRYSADHTGTVPVWTRWIPSLVALLLLRFMPPATPPAPPAQPEVSGMIRTQAWWLLVAAGLFPALLALAGSGDGWYIVLKLAVLVGLPLILFWLGAPATRVVDDANGRWRTSLGRWYWLGPVLPVVAWFYLSYATPLALPQAAYAWPDTQTLVVTLLVVFLINAVVEEYFYRVWLQSRLELLLGRWPAIVVAAAAWAVWHVVIQGGQGVVVDLAMVMSNQGVQGLFLGYLWSRYRNIWVLLLVHGAVNAAGILLALL
ncbi:MAG TPA: CPBP family glutamic-type intramembrane protease [Roseiflexaceae bacterium]|nr:CPBP family glutamic-type intramembrane protease [Roseiflexaceae bacterium]